MIMRFILMALLISSTSCVDEARSNNQTLSTKSENRFEYVTMCISQNINSAFPRFFLKHKSHGKEIFQTVNGIEVQIEKNEKTVDIVVNYEDELNIRQKQYINYCAGPII